MNREIHWYQHRSDVYKAAYKWVKHGIAAAKIDKEELFYKYSCVLLSSKKGAACWSDVVDVQATAGLERNSVLNWSQLATQMYAIRIPGDKVSFSHAASVSLWGIPDKKGLVNFLVKSTLKLHRRVWEVRLTQNTAHNQKVDDLISDSGRLLPQHIFVLSNVIQRPIIIVSDEERRVLSEEEDVDPYFGVYLPLMSKPIDCFKTPIYLAYLKGQFYPLVGEGSMKDTGAVQERCSLVFPLVTNDFGMFPVKCLQTCEECRAGDILQDYLIVKNANMELDSGLCEYVFTQSECYTLPEDKNVIFDYLKNDTGFNAKKSSSVKSKLLFKRFKQPTQSPNKKDAQPFGTQVAGHQQLTGSENKPFDDLNYRLYVGTSYECKQMGYMDVTNEPVLPIEPNAPEIPDLPVEPMSMRSERCISCRTFRSSNKTFPYCHECYEQKIKLEMEKPLEENLVKDPQVSANPTALLSVSVGSEAIKNYSPRNLNDNLESPTPNDISFTKEVIEDRKKELSYFDLPRAVGELSDNYQPTDNQFVEVSYQSSVGQKNTEQEGPRTCVSPFCEDEVSLQELLCERCIRILKIHHLSNCSKAYSNNRTPVLKENNTNPEGEIIANQNIKILPFGVNTISSREQQTKEMDNKFPPSIPDECARDAYGLMRSVIPAGYQRMVSQPENAWNNNLPISSTSLVVTNLTSIDEKNPVRNNSSGLGESLTHDQGDEKETLVLRCADQNQKPAISRSGAYHWSTGGILAANKSKEDKKGVYGRSASPNTKTNESRPDYYQQTMENLEYNLKKAANICKTYMCSNYGSKEKDGYCNKCDSERQLYSHIAHFNGMYGSDVCDGAALVEEDCVDGPITTNDTSKMVITNDFTCNTMPRSSSSDSSDYIVDESEDDT